MKNICCLYLTNTKFLKLDNWIIYDIVKNMCLDASIDLFTYIENKDMIDKVLYHYDIKSCEFTYDSLFNKFKYYNIIKTNKNYIGNTFLTLLDLYTWYSYYDYYIFYEDDLGWFSDDNLFKKIDYNYDLIMEKPKKDDHWFWLNNYTNIKFNNKYAYCGLLNLYIVSNKFLKELYNYILTSNKYGHFEYLIKSFAYDNNFNIGYLNDMIDLELDFNYNNLSGKYHDLIHPIKNMSILNYYLNLKNEQS